VLALVSVLILKLMLCML